MDHFKLKSTDDNLEADKRLDFDIWYDSKKNIIVKVEYKRLGKWQYILKKKLNNILIIFPQLSYYLLILMVNLLNN